MTQRITRKEILKAIGSDKLKLWNTNHYWWFEFDDYKATKRYDTHSVYVMRLSQLSLREWVNEGKILLAQMEMMQLQNSLNNLK